MKNRAETKESIRQKSHALLARRRKRRYAVGASVGAACAAAFCLWVHANALRQKSVPPLSEMGGGTYGSEGVTKKAPDTAAYGEIGEAFNAVYSSPDSVRIYTVPPTDELVLSSANASDRQDISRLNDWFAGIGTGGNDMDAPRRNTMNTVYVVERTYGSEVTVVYVCGNAVRWDGGGWHVLDDSDAADFAKMMDDFLY